MCTCSIHVRPDLKPLAMVTLHVHVQCALHQLQNVYMYVYMYTYMYMYMYLLLTCFKMGRPDLIYMYIRLYCFVVDLTKVDIYDLTCTSRYSMLP